MSESFAALFEESLARSNMKSGQVISAEVVRIDHNFVVVNAGLKSEAFIPVEEFHNDQGEIDVQPGDFVSVAIDALENGYGDTILSRDKAKRLASWMNLEKALEQGEIVTGAVTGKVKGGLTVMVNGIRAFLPGSLLDTRPIKDTSPYEGKTMDFKVIKLDRKRNNVVLSRRAVVEASQGEERQKLMDNLKEGTIVQGTIKNITDYGAFVDLGGIDGLLHITDLAWRRVRHPSEVLTVGQEVTAKILRYDQDKNRVSLGIKQLGDDPWVGIARRYPPNTRLFGKVTNLTDYGAFVEIESGIEGLVHVSEMDWTNKNIAPGKAVQLGLDVEVMVLDIDEDKRRISLGMKQCKTNPWDEFARNHNKVDTVVLAIDVEKERISLGIKQLSGDPFNNYTSENDKGALVSGVIKSVDAKGAVVELAPEVEAYLRASEISTDRVEDARLALKEGDKVSAMIINVDRKSRSINLSIKAKDNADQQEVISKMQNEASSGTTNLGALLKAKLDNQG